MLILRQTLDEAISGYWDGGKKRTFDWKIDGTPGHDAKGSFVKVGSWGANHWFHVAVGKSNKATLGNARRRLGYFVKRAGHTCQFEYVSQ